MDPQFGNILSVWQELKRDGSIAFVSAFSSTLSFRGLGVRALVEFQLKSCLAQLMQLSVWHSFAEFKFFLFTLILRWSLTGEFSVDFKENLGILYAFIFAGLNSLFQFEPQH